ncbi:MAG: hypothetical protein ABIO82_03395 [Ginsengibacter sp.]
MFYPNWQLNIDYDKTPLYGVILSWMHFSRNEWATIQKARKEVPRIL